MQIRIILKNDVYDEIFALMQHIKDLNDDKEIAGWLLGGWSRENDKLVLRCDEFIIPKQEVSGSDVDINPDGMIDMIKEIGFEKSNRIVAHWHIHPFGNGNTDWSGTDETKIKDFMEPIKGREIFCFLLSSYNQIKGRVEFNLDGNLSKVNASFPIRYSEDDLEVERDTPLPTSPFIDKLKKRIEEKVTQKTYSTTVYSSDDKDEWKKHFAHGQRNKDYVQQEFVQQNLFEISLKKKDRIVLILENAFAEFMQGMNWGHGIEDPDETRITKKGRQIWTYYAKDKKTRKKLSMQFDDILCEAENDFLMENIELDDDDSRGYRRSGYYL